MRCCSLLLSQYRHPNIAHILINATPPPDLDAQPSGWRERALSRRARALATWSAGAVAGVAAGVVAGVAAGAAGRRGRRRGRGHSFESDFGRRNRRPSQRSWRHSTQQRVPQGAARRDANAPRGGRRSNFGLRLRTSARAGGEAGGCGGERSPKLLSSCCACRVVTATMRGGVAARAMETKRSGTRR